MSLVLPQGVVNIELDDGEYSVGALLTEFILDISQAEERVIHRNIGEISTAVVEYIREQIAVLHPLKDFMANRTGAELEANGDEITITIMGLPETEVNDEYTERRKTPVSKPYNLWALFEEGSRGGGNIVTGKFKFAKMTGEGAGTTVVGGKKTHRPLYEFAGEVENIIEQIMPDIAEFLSEVLYTMFNAYFAESLERGSGGKLKIDPTAITSMHAEMSGGGFNLTSDTRTTLRRMGFDINVSNSGQVSLRNLNTGRFSTQTKEIKNIIQTDPNYIVFHTD